MRLFIALPLPEEIEEHLGKVIFALKQKRGKVKWVAPKNIHLTVKFLGEVEEDRIDKITPLLSEVAKKYHVIRTSTDRIGAFPNPKHPKILWAGLNGETDRMADLAGAVEDALVPLGFEKENRKFKAHLTLGRIKDGRDLNELTAYLQSYDFTPAAFTMDRIVLFKSTLTPRGPIYDRLFEAVLPE